MYNHPPVRSTVFTVYFQELDLDLAAVTDLRNKWVQEYPGFKQVIPAGRGSRILPPTDLLTLRWPMPAAEMADSSLSRTLAFQFDQFSLKWKFDSDAETSGYPGYATLADELIERFTEFVGVVDKASDSTVVVEGCQCSYTNTLAGIGGEGWLTSFLSVDETIGPLDGLEHFGFHINRKDEFDGFQRSVFLHLDAGEQRPDDAVVGISAVAVPADGAEHTQGESTELARKLLDAAHALENQTFESSFSETMKKEWEERP